MCKDYYHPLFKYNFFSFHLFHLQIISKILTCKVSVTFTVKDLEKPHETKIRIINLSTRSDKIYYFFIWLFIKLKILN